MYSQPEMRERGPYHGLGPSPGPYTPQVEVDALCSIFFIYLLLFLHLTLFFCDCWPCRSAIASQCPMALIREDQPAARAPAIHPVLMEVEAVAGLEE